jgi:hypothetical protein
LTAWNGTCAYHRWARRILLEKFDATFDLYWESPEYESYEPNRDAARFDRPVAPQQGPSIRGNAWCCTYRVKRHRQQDGARQVLVVDVEREQLEDITGSPLKLARIPRGGSNQERRGIHRVVASRQVDEVRDVEHFEEQLEAPRAAEDDAPRQP